MSDELDRELVMLHFESPGAADQALASIRTLAAEGFLELEDGVVITADDAGSVTVRGAEGPDRAGKIGVGGVLGLVAGGLVGLPVLGVIAGAGVVAKRSKEADYLHDVIASASTRISPGTAVVAALIGGLNDPEVVADRLEVHRGELIRADVPAGLRAQIDEAT